MEMSRESVLLGRPTHELIRASESTTVSEIGHVQLRVDSERR
jgi:hypothetical protein